MIDDKTKWGTVWGDNYYFEVRPWNEISDIERNTENPHPTELAAYANAVDRIKDARDHVSRALSAARARFRAKTRATRSFDNG